MIGGRVLLGGLIASVVGATLIAALVVGRGGQAEVLTRQTLDDEGGVMWTRIESYERLPFERVFNPRPERTIQQTWTRFAPDMGAETIFASHTIDGVLLARSRLVGGNVVDAARDVGERRSWPRPSGHSIGLGGGPVCDPGLELVPSERLGAPMCVGSYARPPTGAISSAGRPAWPIDLDVVSVQREVRLHPRGGPLSETFRALLEDGSHVVIASQRYHFEVLPLSEWDAIEGLVFGSEPTLADLDDGGVLVVRVEIYQRHGAKLDQLARLRADGDIGLHPESRVAETWMLLGPGGEILDAATAQRTDDGAIYERIRSTSDGTVIERPEGGVREEMPPRDADSRRFEVPFTELLAAAHTEFDERVESGDWSEVPAPEGLRQVERRRPIDAGSLVVPASANFSVPYYGDLSAVELVTVSTLVRDPIGGREERFVVLEDGSRVLVESRRTTLGARTRAEWEAFIAEVWGE